jgi:hypothetical protein
MDSGITYPFIQSELEQRRSQARPGTGVRRHGARSWTRRRLTRTDGTR